jgi:hypothetical protein
MIWNNKYLTKTIKIQRTIHQLTFLLLILSFTNFFCYSLKGVVIENDVKDFSVSVFINNSGGAAPATMGQVFSEKLKTKIRTNTRLTNVNTDGEMSYSGSIVEYVVTAIAPQPGQQAVSNQLKITVAIEMTRKDPNEDKKSWRQQFSFQENFPGSSSLLSVQDQLIESISTKIIDDIFNKSFTENW